MELHIFRTDIKTKKKIKSLRPIFDNHRKISDWNVDIEDIDNVLRIEGDKSLSERELIEMVHDQGYFIEALPD